MTGQRELGKRANEIAGKRREIKRRYARRYPQQPISDRLAAMARAELRRLVHYRSGGKLSRAELDRRMTRVLGADWQSCPGHELANRALALRITLEKRMHLDIRRFPPTDVTREQQKWAYKVRRREKDRVRRKSKRKSRLKTGEAIMKASDLSVRRETLLFLLKATGRWLDINQLADAVKDFAAWRCPDGSRMSPASLQVRIRDALNALEADGFVQQKRAPAKRGGLTKRLVKCAPEEGVAQQRNNKGVRTKKSIDEMGTSVHVSNADPSVSAHDSYLLARTQAVASPSGLFEEALISPTQSLDHTTLYPSSDTKH